MDINFFMPVNVKFGENCIEKNIELFAPFERALIVTGKSSAKLSGAQDDIIKALTANKIEFTVFDEVSENPLLSTCYKGGDRAAEFGADLVIAIGGGSPIDAAKAMCAIATNRNLRGNDLFGEIEKQPLPLFVVPTTAGTGSEANPYSIITIDDENIKRTFNKPVSYAKYAFLDPKYTYSLSEFFTISTALDAFAHCIESYHSVRSTSLSEVFALSGAKTIWECLKIPFVKFTPEIREKLLYGSLLGGIAINSTSTCFPHPMGYNLTLDKGLPHGRACAVFTAEFLAKCEMVLPEKTAQFLRFIGAESGELKMKITELAAAPKYSLTDEEITKYIENAKNAANIKNCPFVFTTENMREIYEKI